jgi:hypothetical protein
VCSKKAFLFSKGGLYIIKVVFSRISTKLRSNIIIAVFEHYWTVKKVAQSKGVKIC